MGVPDNNTMLVQVDFEVFGRVQGGWKIKERFCVEQSARVSAFMQQYLLIYDEWTWYFHIKRTKLSPLKLVNEQLAKINSLF